MELTEYLNYKFGIDIAELMFEEPAFIFTLENYEED